MDLFIITKKQVYGPEVFISPAAWPSSDNLQLYNLGKSPTDLEQWCEECPYGEMHCEEAGHEMEHKMQQWVNKLTSKHKMN